MALPQVRRAYSRQEYYSFDEWSSNRNEYCCGEIFAMAGGSPTHAYLIGQTTTELNLRLRDSSCYAVPSDQRVRIEAEDMETYPDVVVLCEDARFDPLNSHTLLEPRLLVEVLSPSTADYDRTVKLAAYQQIPTLTDYLIVWQDQICIEHHARSETAWTMRRYQKRDDVMPVEGFAIEIPLAELYRRLDLPEAV
jgi:Uma2 family endonuclease